MTQPEAWCGVLCVLRAAANRPMLHRHHSAWPPYKRTNAAAPHAKSMLGAPAVLRDGMLCEAVSRRVPQA